MKRYELAPAVPDVVAEALSEYAPLQQQLLCNRGIVSREAAQVFLEPDYITGQHDPFLLSDMETAVTRILAALDQGERITIFSDYDCDGIPGGVLLHDFFAAVGYKNFTNYIPHRHYEGFGLSVSAVDKTKEDKATLIITIDCGTSSNEAIAHAATLGIDVIVTDHHEAGAELPKAVAVVNPKVGDTYPFTGLCGTGVVFKLVQALLTKRDWGLKPGWEKWWLDMVAVATIADMVPLVGENRVFACYGLQVLRKSRRPGLQKLLKKAKADQRYLTEDDIGFTIGPRVNAASRMDTPEDAFHMLAETDEAKAGARVDHLEKLNTERKSAVSVMSRELHKRIEGMTQMPEVLVLGNPEWRPSLVGLAAGKLAELHNRPAFIWGRDGNGVLKGSARAGGDVSVVKLMNAVPSEVWLEFGGHHQAGGFSVADDAIHTLSEALNIAHDSLGTAAREESVLTVDADITLADINQALLTMLQKTGPFGVGNAKPIFRLRDVAPESVATFGKTKEHTKLVFTGPNGIVEAIAFFAPPEHFSFEPKAGDGCTLLVHIEESFFMGRKQTRLRIIDVVTQ